MARRLIDAENFKQYCKGGLIECEKELKAAGRYEFAKMITEDLIKDIDEQPTIPAIPLEQLGALRAALERRSFVGEKGMTILLSDVYVLLNLYGGRTKDERRRTERDF